MPPPSPPPSAGTIEVRVRYVECDPMGVAHHSAFAVWFEMGRTELLRRSSDVPYRELESEGVFFAVTRLDVRVLYDAPLPRAVKHLEQNLLEKTLIQTNWNKSRPMYWVSIEPNWSGSSDPKESSSLKNTTNLGLPINFRSGWMAPRSVRPGC